MCSREYLITFDVYSLAFLSVELCRLTVSYTGVIVVTPFDC